MRILWNSSSPDCHSGYGNATREIIKRLRKDGHFVRVATKHAYTHFGHHIDRYETAVQLKAAREAVEAGRSDDALAAILAAREELEGTVVFEGTMRDVVIHMLKAEDFDIIFTLWDIWGMLADRKYYPKDKWVAHVPIDSARISERLAKVLPHTGMQVAMSEHGKREMENIGYEPRYAPLGVNTDIFHPDEAGRQRFRSSFGLTDEHFLIGSVGINYGIDDRKGFIALLRAFKIFRDAHEEARLYLHTHAKGLFPQTLDLLKIAYDLGVHESVMWCNQEADMVGRIDDDWMRDTYCGLDLFCLPSKGEGVGLPVIEAMACGTPAAMTDTTTGQELVGETGWLIDVCDNDLKWMPSGAWRHEVGEVPIVKAMEAAFSAWKYSDYGKIQEKAVRFARTYDWDTIWKKYWQPLFAEIDEWAMDGKAAKEAETKEALDKEHNA